ncbi:MAG: hypothetical protein COZ56_01175 [Armatimonadetes bacterium CG_4_8_14_3_um_filter_58_9]|nr:MAG: hypothetical protein COZ56_01175 [Armatimonadetes bacterium CG_4_8_14_3_um_filter_58_9]PJB65552.1 MAG: hypothetical protein CO095_13960 [Armatimonadetes bacterium CG_4_9_14_3_um_filter_58_7]
MDPVKFVRVVRTSSSEVYILWEDEERVGQLDVHFAHDVIHATIILERETSEDDRRDLVNQIDQEIINSYLPSFDREDFLVSVFQGEEVDAFNDAGDLEDEFDLDDEY